MVKKLVFSGLKQNISYICTLFYSTNKEINDDNVSF
jgi:hypothetical protein